MRCITVAFAMLAWAVSTPIGAQPAGTAVSKIVGERHKLLLGAEGQVVGWGAFDDGQLGAAGGSNRLDAGFNLPVLIPLPSRATDVAAGEGTSYALLADGTVVAWGRADAGQMGDGSVSFRDFSKAFQNGVARPVRVAGLVDVVQISAAGGSALALHRDGSVSAWGSRGAGVIGDGQHPKRYGESGPPATTPVRVPGVSGIVHLSTSGAHVLALTGDGRVLSWGSNHYGALGRPPRQELPMDQAAEVPGLADVIAVAAGLGVSTALKKDGTVWVWGANWHGQFGNGSQTDPPGMTSGFELVPRRVPGISGVAALTVGLTGRHTLVLLKDGTLRGWGNTDWGQIGAGVAETYQPTPVIPKIAGVKSILAAGNQSFAIKSDGSVWVWGAGGPRSWPLKANTPLPVRLELALPR
jgi:alpha-tubulin suppressor-like RCC1 family protein